MANNTIPDPIAQSPAIALQSPLISNSLILRTPTQIIRRSTTKVATIQQQQQQLKVSQTLWIGALSGMVGISAVYPVDLVKTRLQSQKDASITAFQVFRNALRSEGPLGLYKGLLPQLLGTGPDKAISLATRDFIRRYQNDPNSANSIMVAGACAGGVQSAVMNPVEMLKVNMQLSNGSTKIVSLVRNLGFFGLYRGYSACFCRDVAFASMYFTIFDLVKLKLHSVEQRPSIWVSLLAGTVAGVPAALITTPIDVIKTRMQAPNRPAGMNIISLTKQIIRNEGATALMKGWGPRVSRIAPQFGIVLVTYDFLKSFIAVD